MKKIFFVPEQYRFNQVHPMYRSQAGDLFGWFRIPLENCPGAFLMAMASSGEESGWDHVSVVRHFNRHQMTPTWEDMAKVKDLFWAKDTYVVQYHPPASEYVNNHPYCLHLWRKVGFEYPLPDSLMVGLKQLNINQ